MDDTASQKHKHIKKVDGTFENPKYRMHIHYAFEESRERLREHRARGVSSTLFSRGTRTRTFFTADSHRYITSEEQTALLFGMHRYERTGHFDSVQIRYARPSKSPGELLYRELKQRYADIGDTFAYGREMLNAHISPARVWNASIVGAIFFGMFSMTLVYRYLGQQVSAESTSLTDRQAPVVLGAETQIPNETLTPIIQPEVITPIIALESIEQTRFNQEVTDMVKGYPIEAMLPYILKQDRDVAAFLIGIGKKESNWGKRVPVLNGKDCYNYWGYRGIRDKMGSGGHTCFNNPEDAVTTVAKRIKTLVQENKLNTPAKMIVWKCGSTCKGHSAESVRKWIADVEMYLPESK